MNFCPECGAKLDFNEAKFCYECGASLKRIVDPQTKEFEDSNLESNNENAINENCKIQEKHPDNLYKKEKPDENQIRCTDAIEKVEGEEETLDSTFEETEQESEPKNTDIETNDYSDTNELCCYEIASTHTKEDFIRKVWLQIAQDNVPEDVFSMNLSDVIVNDEEVYENFFKVQLDYNASVGYDREEPYIGYEYYYDKEPYITIETYYDHNIKANRTRQVTKYKDVKRERQVTKYKTVTDWSAHSGTGTTTSLAIVSNTEQELDKHLYLKSTLSEDEKAARTLFSGTVSPSAKRSAMSIHHSELEDYISKSLPGDRNKDIKYNINNIISSYETIYKLKKYSVTISYNGIDYEKYAYPIGTMPIGGDVIENDQSPEALALQKRTEVNEQNNTDRERKDYVIFKQMKWISLSALALILTSIAVSCFLRNPVIVAISFALAIGSYILDTAVFKRKEKSVSEEIEQKILERNKQLNSDIENYASNYEKRMYELLNNKLLSLGMKAYEKDEFAENEE